MKWMKAKEVLPANGEETLIRSRGIFLLAVFNESENVFICKNGDRYKPADDLMWTGLIGKDLRQSKITSS
jgi:hypothetical protein